MPLSATTDPLAGYSPNWRQTQGADPLAGYTPDWRTSSASTAAVTLPTIPRQGTDVSAVQTRKRASGPLGPAVEGFMNAIPDFAASVVKFPFQVLGSTVFAPPTPEELRNPYVRARLRANGVDPDAMLHEAIKETATGERASPMQGVQNLAAGTARFGYDLQSAIAPGPNLGNLVYDALTGKQSSQALIEENPQGVAAQLEPGARGAAMLNFIGNTALLGLGARKPARALPAETPGEAIVPTPEAPPTAAPDALRSLTDEQLAAQPLGQTPPVEGSNLAAALKVPEFVRATAADIQAYHETTAPAPTTIVRMPVSEIVADPQRFQFKQLGSEGVSTELKGVTRFNDQLAGVVSVWRDPVDGQLYVVNGHHRLDLARRLGAKELNVQFIDAPDAKSARAEGAMINLAEGRGTATDVGKFLRDMNATPGDLAVRGITLTGPLSRDGLALSRLAPDVFDQVATAKIPQAWGVAMGELLPDPALQREALAVMKGGQRLTQGEAYEVARQVRDAGTEAVTQETLFGTDVTRRGLFLNRARVAAAIRRKLATDKRLFGFVSDQTRATELTRAGTTQIDVGAASDIAAGADRALEVFDKLYTKTGPLADVIATGAKRVAHGESPATVAASIYPAVGDAVAAELRPLTGPRPDVAQRPDAGPVRSLADEIAAESSTEARPVESRDVAQAGLFTNVAGVIETGTGQADIFARPPENLRRGSIHAVPDPLQANIDPANLAPHSRRLQERISVGGRNTRWDGLRAAWQRFYAGAVRRVAPLEATVKKIGGGTVLHPGSDPAAAAILASGSGARADAFMEIGPFRLDAQGTAVPTGTPSLKAILAPVKDYNALRRYALAQRDLDLARRMGPVPGGPSIMDALTEIANADPVTRTAFNWGVRYQADLMQHLQDAGGISDGTVAALHALHRGDISWPDVFAGKDRPPKLAAPAATADPGVTTSMVIRAADKTQVWDPIESLIDQTQRVIRAAGMQRVKTQLVGLADAFPEATKGLIDRVGGPPVQRLGETITPTPEKATLAAQQVREASQGRGVNVTDAQAREMAELMGDPPPADQPATITVTRHGQPETWRIAPELASALRTLSPQELPLWATILGAPAQALKAGVTLQPTFPIFNMIRDSFDATLQSRYGFRLGLDSFKGFWEALPWKQGPRFEEFMRSGAGYADITGQTRRSVQTLERRLLPRSAAMRYLIDPVRHPLQALKDFGRPFETAARLGEFMRARTRGASEVEAALAARRVTTDFAMSGASANAQAFAHTVAFMNPAVQSLDTMIRAVGDHPGRLAVLGVSAITLPTIYNWFANRHDQDIQDIRRTPGGAQFWYYRTPEGHIGRVPKPFAWGQLFGSSMENALDALYDKQPETLNRWWAGVVPQIGFNVVPDVAKTWYGLKYNQEPFFQTPIVPQGLEHVDPQYQATEYNTQLARHLGATFNVSPARFEFVVRQLTGTLGMDVLRGASAVVDDLSGGQQVPQPSPVAADWPLVSRLFARSPSTTAEPVRTFYAHAADAERTVATAKLLAKRDPTKAEAYMNAHLPELGVAGAYVAGRAELSALRRQLDAIRQSPDIPPETKRAMLDEVLRQMVETARRYNDAVRDLRETP